MKAIETKKDLKQASSLLKRQIKALSTVVKNGVGHEDLLLIVDEKQALLDYITSNKCWNFNFKHGGWNTVYATTKQEAYKLARTEYDNDGNTFEYGVIESDGSTGTRTGVNKPTIVDKTTLRVATPADTKMLLSSFY